ncbi:MAG: glutamyl-tRNA amidotransferase subunit [Polyangiaceae bacterium]|jgi:aspartyl-tRNA(Asn)/glutamyl-tRNA(Gln) amidotransferase subunit C|nr:glutamyl-tRNA amidotransferase subunit [Polyangiaceae bacterium]
MAITRENVLHVAKLARLELTETEIDRMQRDLDGILEYVNQLSELDTKDVPATTQVAVVAAPFRSDEPRPSLPHDLALGQAPRFSSDGFAVPAFVDE